MSQGNAKTTYSNRVKNQRGARGLGALSEDAQKIIFADRVFKLDPVTQTIYHPDQDDLKDSTQNTK